MAIGRKQREELGRSLFANDAESVNLALAAQSCLASNFDFRLGFAPDEKQVRQYLLLWPREVSTWPSRGLQSYPIRSASASQAVAPRVSLPLAGFFVALGRQPTRGWN